MQRGSSQSQRPRTQAKASDQRSAMNSEKKQELHELSKIKEQSELMVQYFENLQKNMQSLSQDVQGTSNMLANWNHVSRIMAAMKEDEEPSYVRLPIDDPKPNA